MASSDPPPTVPPQVRVINAWGTVLVALIGSITELGVVIAATYGLVTGHISVEVWGLVCGAPLVGPAIARAQGKSPNGTIAAMIAAATIHRWH